MHKFLAILASIALVLAPAWAQAICTTSMQDGAAAETAMVVDGTSVDCEDRAPVEEGEADACLIAMTLVCAGALSAPEDSGAVASPSTSGNKVVRLGSASVRSTAPEFDTPPPRV